MQQPHAGEKREKRTDVGPGKPPKDKQFSSTNQPKDPNKSALTRKRKKFARDLIRDTLMNLSYKFGEESKVREQLRKAFGDSVDNLTAAEIMTLQQIQKAVLQGDTQAYNAVMNQAFGMPKAINELTGPNGGPIETVQKITKVIIENPHGAGK